MKFGKIKNVDSADIRVHISKIRQKTYDDFIVSSRGFRIQNKCLKG